MTLSRYCQINQESIIIYCRGDVIRVHLIHLTKLDHLQKLSRPNDRTIMNYGRYESGRGILQATLPVPVIKHTENIITGTLEKVSFYDLQFTVVL